MYQSIYFKFVYLSIATAAMLQWLMLNVKCSVTTKNIGVLSENNALPEEKKIPCQVGKELWSVL